MTEAEFQQTIIEAARLLGWKVYHTHDSRRSEPGFPDLVLVKDRVMFREVKTDEGTVSPAQRDWLSLLSLAGEDASVWRPMYWDTIIKELKEDARYSVRANRGTMGVGG